jgi:hypothetical protein
MTPGNMIPDSDYPIKGLTLKKPKMPAVASRISEYGISIHHYLLILRLWRALLWIRTRFGAIDTSQEDCAVTQQLPTDTVSLSPDQVEVASSQVEHEGENRTAGPLGRLQRVDLRDHWASEAVHFTPWLAHPSNIALLGETLGLRLECETREKGVGPFRADILCRDIDTDHWVLIENQIERTDHIHLGQLLTYASGLEAVTVIWVAARFTDEHRAALDWLNKITADAYRFFGVEIELWQIGNSAPAPKFNIVAKPNGWSQRLVRAARAMHEVNLSETRLLQRDYWAALNAVLDAAGGPVLGNRKPQPQHYMTYSIGHSGCHLNAFMMRNEGKIRVELCVIGDDAKQRFKALRSRRADIEKALGYDLDWEELPEQRDCRIATYLSGVDPEDRLDWPRQHAWLAQRLNSMHRTFSGQIHG